MAGAVAGRVGIEPSEGRQWRRLGGRRGEGVRPEVGRPTRCSAGLVDARFMWYGWDKG